MRRIGQVRKAGGGKTAGGFARIGKNGQNQIFQLVSLYPCRPRAGGEGADGGNDDIVLAVLAVCRFQGSERLIHGLLTLTHAYTRKLYAIRLQTINLVAFELELDADFSG